MGTGLITGMGYLGYAVLFAVILSIVMVAYNKIDFGKKNDLYRTIHITIPEDLDYTDVFKDTLNEYTSASELTTVKTTNMGSLFKLTYNVTLKDPVKEKEMIDKLRCLNGNLEIVVSRQENVINEL